LAGIGYQMLRLCHPGELPSVLALNSNPHGGLFEIEQGRGPDADMVVGGSEENGVDGLSRSSR
jgi:hypothetical protein